MSDRHEAGLTGWGDAEARAQAKAAAVERYLAQQRRQQEAARQHGHFSAGAKEESASKPVAAPAPRSSSPSK